MRTEGMYPAPVQGVSTLSPRNRAYGKAGLQVNFRSDPVKKLTRRPPLEYKDFLQGGVGFLNLFHHRYERDGKVYRIIIEKSTGSIFGYIDGVPTTVTGALGAYRGTNYTAQTVDNVTYLVNTDKVVELVNSVETNTIKKVSHINITSALAYGETLTVNIRKQDGTLYTRNYVVPSLIASGNPEDPPDYDRADKARATKKVAEELASTIDLIVGITARALGSSVGVWVDDLNEWLDIEIETGQGDRSAVAINRVIENIDGLPLYAYVGTRIKVRPDPTSEKGVYYLQAERTGDNPTGFALEEVVWAESRSPDENYMIDAKTMPHKLEFVGNNLEVSTGNWKERQAGDDDSVPVPEFVGNTINNVGYFQKRLVFLTENFAVMSETDDVDNFWRQSAVNLLVSDKVAVASSATGVDKLEYLIPHNRDLLIMSSTAQFKISGTTPITPQTVSMTLTTSYDCRTNTRPVSMGNSVYFPIDYGVSSGIQEYSGEKDTGQDVANQITKDVIGYIEGSIRLMAAAPNLNMIAVLSGSVYNNIVYIYEKTDSDKVGAWSKWEFGGGAEIVDIAFSDDELEIVCVEDQKTFVKSVRMYSTISDDREVYLDDLVYLDTDGLTCELPAEYVVEDITCIGGIGTSLNLLPIKHTISGTTIKFDEDVGAGKVFVGKLYTSRYVPTRPFRYNEDGQAITTDRLRVGKFILGLVDTNEVKMQIVSDYYDYQPQVFNSRFVGGIKNVLGSVPFYTGDYKFSFSQDANLADAEFYCDNWLGCTINSISWEGQYYQSKGRM